MTSDLGDMAREGAGSCYAYAVNGAKTGADAEACWAGERNGAATGTGDDVGEWTAGVGAISFF
jgi:hypothetical protein